MRKMKSVNDLEIRLFSEQCEMCAEDKKVYESDDKRGYEVT